MALQRVGSGPWLVGILLVPLALAGCGEPQGPGTIEGKTLPDSVIAATTKRVRDASQAVGVDGSGQILFGDLHVHTTFSADAFEASLPINSGEGAHPPADACDFARFCAGLDFWSINDHAEASTPRRWRETRESIRECNARAGDPANPDVVAFLGWEWTQIGSRPNNHYGHKNVVLRDTEEGRVPSRPIASTVGLDIFNVPVDREAVTSGALWAPLRDPGNWSDHLSLLNFQRDSFSVDRCAADVASPDLPEDCKESAATPEVLFRKLDEWGFESLVIPHGNAWGLYTPPGASWDKQLRGPQHDAKRQTLIEVYSGHGNSEEYRDWRRVSWSEDGEALCPQPRPDFLPCCWRAGEIVAERCRAAGGTDCDEQQRAARSNYATAGVSGHHTVPGATAEDWLDCSQCRDCFLPGFKHTPGTSAQAALAVRSFDVGEPRRFRMGFIASSDNHSARPGTGYKEFARTRMTDVQGPVDAAGVPRAFPSSPLPEGRYGLAPEEIVIETTRNILETERRMSFLYTGGLVAVHAEARDRHSIWDALKRNRVYGTSGPRILLWFDGLVESDGSGRPSRLHAMGSVLASDRSPKFRVRAVGSLEQLSGCPNHSTDGLSSERLARLCAGECYHPTDTRHIIDRIEVVRVRPQIEPGEDLERLIDDPWRVLACDRDPSGCTVEFTDPDFARDGRDSVYYVRAIQVATEAVNAAGLRCVRDESGRCVESRPCRGGYRTPADDDCLAPAEERAWSSPIYVDHSKRR